MSKSFLITFTLSVLFNFGLCSCSKDQSSTDNFTIAAPVLHAQYREPGASFKLNTQDVGLDSQMLNAVYPTSVIEMPSLKNQNFAEKPITIDVISVCQASAANPGGQQESFTTRISNVESFQLMNLVNPSFLVNTSNSQTNTTCSFDFNFEDSLGSTESFRYKDIPVAPLIRGDLVDFNVNSRDEKGVEFDHALAIVSENRNKNVRYPLVSQTHLGYIAKPKDRILLVCENYISQISARDTNEISLAQFDKAPLIWNKNLNGVDPRISQPAEDCRLMHETTDSNKTMKFSRQFHLVQKTSDLKISASVITQLFTQMSSQNRFNSDHAQEMIHLQIMNPTNDPIRIALPTLQVQFIGQISNLPNKMFNQDIIPLLQGGQFLRQDPRFGKILSIAAQSEVNVSYVLSFPGACTINASPDLGLGIFSKIYFQALSNLKVIQIVGTDDAPEYFKTYEDVDLGLAPPNTVIEIGHMVLCRGL